MSIPPWARRCSTSRARSPSTAPPSNQISGETRTAVPSAASSFSTAATSAADASASAGRSATRGGVSAPSRRTAAIRSLSAPPWPPDAARWPCSRTRSPRTTSSPFSASWATSRWKRRGSVTGGRRPRSSSRPAPPASGWAAWKAWSAPRMRSRSSAATGPDTQPRRSRSKSSACPRAPSRSSADWSARGERAVRPMSASAPSPAGPAISSTTASRASASSPARIRSCAAFSGLPRRRLRGRMARTRPPPTVLPRPSMVRKPRRMKRWPGSAATGAARRSWAKRRPPGRELGGAVHEGHRAGHLGGPQVQEQPGPVTEGARSAGEEQDLHVEDRGGRHHARVGQRLAAGDGGGLHAGEVHRGALPGRGARRRLAVDLHGACAQLAHRGRRRHQRERIPLRRPSRRGWSR